MAGKARQASPNTTNNHNVFTIHREEVSPIQVERKRVTHADVEGIVQLNRATRHPTQGREDDDEIRKARRTTTNTIRETEESKEKVPEAYITTTQNRKSRRGDDPLIIHGYVLQWATISIYINTGSVTNTMNLSSFQALPQEVRNTFKPGVPPRSGYEKHTNQPLGTTTIPVTLLDHEGFKQRSEVVTFTITNTVGSYDATFGRNGLWTFGAVPSTVHGLLKFKTQEGTATVFGRNGNRETSGEIGETTLQEDEDREKKRTQQTKTDTTAEQDNWKKPLIKKMKTQITQSMEENKPPTYVLTTLDMVNILSILHEEMHPPTVGTKSRTRKAKSRRPKTN